MSASLPAPWSVALCVPATRWQRWQAHWRGQSASACYLAADAAGRWAIGQARAPSLNRSASPDAPLRWQPVVIEKLWRGPYWWTLRLVARETSGPSASSHPARRTWTLTLWRSRYCARDWRRLCVLLRAWRGPQPVLSAASAVRAHGA